MALGEQIVRELELEEPPNTLRRWMAHHLAEHMLRARDAQGEDRVEAEEKAVALILRIWASRRDSPGSVSPLRRLENVIAVMDRMRPEAWPFRSMPDTEIVRHLTKAFDGLRTIVYAGVLVTQMKSLEQIAPAAASLFLDEDEHETLQQINEWVEFVSQSPPQHRLTRFTITDKEATALEADEGLDAETEALPESDRALLRLDEDIGQLIETLEQIRSQLATGRP